MTIDTDSVSVPFECPHCQYELSALLGQLRRYPQVTCDNCGTNIDINLDTSDLDRKVGNVNRKIDGLLKDFKDINITL